MIVEGTEFYSSPYYFFLKDKGNYYSLYFSSESTLKEAKEKDVMVRVPKDKVKAVKEYIRKLTKEKTKKTTDDIKGEIEELVDTDGTLSGSKIPILDPRLHPKKTMDQTVAAARITNDPIARGYRTYYGESVMKEVDLSTTFGGPETNDMDGKETYKYFKDELEMEPDEAKERTLQQGKDPSGKKDKKSKYYKQKNFITRATLSELKKQKALKMVEDILMKSKDSEESEVSKKEIELPKILKKNLKSVKRQAERDDIPLSAIIKFLKGE